MNWESITNEQIRSKVNGKNVFNTILDYKEVINLKTKNEVCEYFYLTHVLNKILENARAGNISQARNHYNTYILYLKNCNFIKNNNNLVALLSKELPIYAYLLYREKKKKYAIETLYFAIENSFKLEKIILNNLLMKIHRIQLKLNIIRVEFKKGSKIYKKKLLLLLSEIEFYLSDEINDVIKSIIIALGCEVYYYSNET